MRIRGERECRDCGARWSYYETGSVNCPDCGSIRSRGRDEERVQHTKGAATLDLSSVRADVDERPPWELTGDAKEVCREFVRQDGFIDGGELRPLSETHLAARELIHVADLVGRSMNHAGRTVDHVGRSVDHDGRTVNLDDDEELYLLSLLRDADQGERPAPDVVPDSLREARGLAVAESVRAYRREVRDWLEDHPDADVEESMVRLDQVAKRTLALQGDVRPATAERLVAATRDLATAIREDDASALAAAEDRLDRLESIGED